MSASSNIQPDPTVPLCVNLDGALIRSNLLIEGLLHCVRKNVLSAFMMIPWLLRGMTHFKREIARRSSIDIGRLPANREFGAWLRTEHDRGRRIILCTASNSKFTEAVAAHYGIFERVVSNGSGGEDFSQTRTALLEGLFGDQGYDYAGNSLEDIAVWKKARKAIVVEPGAGVRNQIDRIPRLDNVYLPARRHPAGLWLRQLRLHHWAKNLLVFVPAFVSHELLDPPVLLSASLAFLFFGLTASATYILNDLLDLEADRRHPRKCERPLAAGEIPLAHGILGALVLLAFAMAGSFSGLGAAFSMWLLLYLVLTLAYSLVIKRYAMIDVLWLGGLYAIRVVAGAAAIDVVPSFWLIAFSVFIFLSLALAKRYAELRSILVSGGSGAAGRGYTVEDLPLMLSFGTAAGFVSILVFALYINHGAVSLYPHPAVLWLACPILLFWIMRLWRAAYHGDMTDDPLVYACKDRVSRGLALGCLVIVLLIN